MVYAMSARVLLKVFAVAVFGQDGINVIEVQFAGQYNCALLHCKCIMQCLPLLHGVWWSNCTRQAQHASSLDTWQGLGPGQALSNGN